MDQPITDPISGLMLDVRDDPERDNKPEFISFKFQVPKQSLASNPQESNPKWGNPFLDSGLSLKGSEYMVQIEAPSTP